MANFQDIQSSDEYSQSVGSNADTSSLPKPKLPILEHLKGYSLEKGKKDLLAGLNVALLDFPQGMAYAMIAGLPIGLGVYASAIGALTGPVFASSRFILLGPTNATAILLLSALASLGLDPSLRIVALPLLTLMVATLFLAGALLNIGIVIRYVSRSVISGYVTAGGCLIVANQLEHVLGLEVERSGLLWNTPISRKILLKRVPKPLKSLS